MKKWLHLAAVTSGNDCENELRGRSKKTNFAADVEAVEQERFYLY